MKSIRSKFRLSFSESLFDGNLTNEAFQAKNGFRCQIKSNRCLKKFNSEELLQMRENEVFK